MKFCGKYISIGLVFLSKLTSDWLEILSDFFYGACDGLYEQNVRFVGGFFPR